jgi:hypothetical protein
MSVCGAVQARKQNEFRYTHPTAAKKMIPRKIRLLKGHFIYKDQPRES